MKSFNNDKSIQEEFIGLIPAAGFANRVSPLPCSKEIYPVGFSQTNFGGKSHPKAVASYLMENMGSTGLDKIYMIIRKGKWDIPRYYRMGDFINVNLAYVVIDATPGVPYTVDKAYPFIKGKKVLFGFPDILFEPQEAFIRLIKKQSQSKADIVLGLFTTDTPEKVDMVELGTDDKIKNLIIKPDESNLKYTWIIAVWSPAFTSFLHETILRSDGKEYRTVESDSLPSNNKELYMGDIIRKALESGLKAETVKYTDGSYIDIGTLEDLKKATDASNMNLLSKFNL